MDKELLKIHLNPLTTYRYNAVCNLMEEMECVKKQLEENRYIDDDILISRANSILKDINCFHNQIAAYNKVGRLLDRLAEEREAIDDH